MGWKEDVYGQTNMAPKGSGCQVLTGLGDRFNLCSHVEKKAMGFLLSFFSKFQLFYVLFLLCMAVFPACMLMYHMYAVLTKARRGH